MKFKQYTEWQYYLHLLVIEIILFVFMGYFLRIPNYITPGLNPSWFSLFAIFYVVLLVADFIAHGLMSLLGWDD